MSDLPMVFWVPLFLFLGFLPAIFAQEPAYATVVVRGATKVAETDDNFICATIDWWPPDKCNYNHCPWGESTALHLDLSHPFLAKAIRAFNRLRIRIGGSLQDQVVYDVGALKYPCHPFRKMADGLFGFSKGCLHMNRWDELNDLFRKTGAIVTFGLNALYGRHKIRKGVWGGAWNTTNARDFIKYTISKGHQIDSWEFGNELSGSGIGASIGATLYGEDLINLKAIINDLYKNSHPKPLILAPGGFFDQQWYARLLDVSGANTVNVMTHHIYNLGAGDDPHLVSKILDPHHLSQIAGTFINLQQTIQRHGPWASAWVGESGGAYNNGGRHVSNRFVNSFWYLDQLGMASKYKTKVYCRQTLIGGNYGLLNTTTFVPNPDYYRQDALLWHRLMGKGVLAVDSDASPFLRVYAHCSKGKAGITLLLINLSNHTDFRITVQNNMNLNVNVGEQRGSSFLHGLKKTVSWVGRKASDETAVREEYHLTPLDGILRSQTMVLNGTPLELTENGDIPTLDPVLVDMKSPVLIAPLSMAFIAFRNFEAPACV
ncbi:Glycoside hydrolase [Macleaya cordata]|uniref:Glycoside hydrolase n=1 Tax=Macleaya cordata TaxID=56857 RepID=A0A200QNU9_MACCD|nr:Glycoside hydrolase [Macleaya cordata]